MANNSNLLKPFIIFSIVTVVGGTAYRLSSNLEDAQAYRPVPGDETSRSPAHEQTQEKARARVASSSGLLSEAAPAVTAAVKTENAAKGRSPALERLSESEDQVIARYRSWMKENGFAERAEHLKGYFSRSPEGEVLAMAMALSGQTSLNDQMREIHDWANMKIFENPSASARLIGNALPRIGKEANTEREWAVSALYGIGQKSEATRREIRSTLLQEVNRQGVQTLEGMTTLVKVLRIEKNQQWVNEVRKEFAEINPGSDLTEYVALRTER